MGGHDGEDVSLLEQLAEFSQSAGEYGSAMEYWEQIFRIAEKARESPDLLADVLFKMARCRSQTGDYSGALEVLGQASRHLQEDSSDLDRCRIFNEQAFALLRLGRYSEAEEAVRQVTERILDRDASRELAKAQKIFGAIAMRRGDWETASRSLEAALAGFRLVDDREGIAQCLNNLGLMEKNRGNNERAILHLKAALKIAEDLGDTLRVGVRLTNLGILEFRVGHWEEARENWERASRLLEGIGNRWDVASISLNLGNYYRYKRDWDEAARQYAVAREIIEELGEARELVLVTEFQGDLAFSSEAFDEARLLYLEALSGGEALAPRGDLVLETVRRLADLESVVGRLSSAREYVARGMEISESMEEEYERGHLVRIAARIEAAEGDVGKAAEYYRESLRLHRNCRTMFDLAVTQLEYATFCIENIIDLEKAGGHLERARATFERVGAEYEAGHAYLMTAKLEMVCDQPTGEARHHLESAIDFLERAGGDDDQEALQEVHRDIDRLLEETSLSERNDLSALNEFASRVAAASDAPSRVQEIERTLVERLDAHRAALFLADPETGTLDLAPGSDLDAREAARLLDYIHVLRGERAFGPKPLVSTSPGRDPRFARFDTEDPRRLGSVAFMPLFSEDDLLGGLYVDLAANSGYFHQADLDFLVAFATTAAMAVQEMRLDAVRHENLQLRRKLARRAGFAGIITQNRRMLDILDVIERIKDSHTTVLIQGETGTGKELFARAIHEVSSRGNRDLVTVNCAALSRDVLESELFGHVRGAFTDAKSDKIGLLEKADGGTLFLDEIDKTSVVFQERLLRTVDQGEIKPVGSSQVRKIDVRILCASNRPLKDLVDQGRFLKDLYYRLRVISLEIPPLRERKEDVPLLVEHFLEQFTRDGARRVRGMSPEAMSLLVAHDWPGNVRDLRHEVERAVALVDDDAQIGPEDLSSDLQGKPPVAEIPLGRQKLSEYVEQIERALVERALRETSGNRSHAAKLLGISRRGLLNKISRYAIDL
jgi:transcriptional regulator with GAF, ATPase, and Fis domain